MNYTKLITNSYAQINMSGQCHGLSRLAYLGDYIFDFTTYDDNLSELFAINAVEVCRAINENKTFDFIKDPDNYKWFIIMINMPFFSDRLEWGSSIRGAWWINAQNLDTCGLFDGDEQVTEWNFNLEEWEKFIRAIIEFSGQ